MKAGFATVMGIPGLCLLLLTFAAMELISIEGKNRNEADKLVSLKPKDITEDRIGKSYRHDAMS